MTDAVADRKPRESPLRTGDFIAKWLASGPRCDPLAPDRLVTSPYPGLRSFASELNPFFFGRESQKRELKSFFMRQDEASGGERRITFVVGGSGSGKSSIVRAGLIAELPATQLPGANGAWYFAEFRPGTDPVEALLASLRRVVASLGVEDVESMLDGIIAIDDDGQRTISIRALLRFVDDALFKLDARTSGERSGPPRLLLHMDQFEEIFRPECRADGREAVMQLLRDVDEVRPERLFIVATARSEELHRFSEFFGIAGIINSSMYLIDLVDRGDIEDVIVSPAWRLAKLWDLPMEPIRVEAKIPFRGAAVEMIAEAYEVTGEKTPHTADRLPLLQHFLPLIWAIAVDDWIERRKQAPDAIFWIGTEHVLRTPGWQKPAHFKADSEPSGHAAPLGRCLDSAANRVFESAVRLLIKRALPLHGKYDALRYRSLNLSLHSTLPESGDEPAWITSNEARLLQAALCGMAQVDDRGRAVRRVVSLETMSDSSGAAALIATVPDGPDRLRQALAEALDLFEDASLIERLPEPQAGSGTGQYTVTHESLIRCWGRLRDWLNDERSIERALQELTRLEVAVRGSRWTLLDRLFWRSGQRAAALIPTVRAKQLSDIFGSAPVYSGEWADAIVARTLEEVSGQTGGGSDGSGMAPAWRAERIGAIWKKAERFHRLGAFQQRLVAAGVALIIALTAIAIWQWNEASNSYKEATRSHRQALIALATNEALTGETTGRRGIVHDRELAFVIGALVEESGNRLNKSEQIKLIRSTVLQFDRGIRTLFGSDIVLRVNDEGIEEGDPDADCFPAPNSGTNGKEYGSVEVAKLFAKNPTRSLDSFSGNDRPQNFPTFDRGLICVSKDRQWLLYWQAPEVSPIIQKVTRDGHGNVLTQQPRDIRSAESRDEFEKLRSADVLTNTLTALKTAAANEKKVVKFRSNGDTVSFILPAADDGEQQIKSIEMWTTTGFLDATQVNPIPSDESWNGLPHFDIDAANSGCDASDPHCHCGSVSAKGEAQIRIDECQVGIKGAGWDDKILAVTSDPGCQPKSLCTTFVEIRYKDGEALRRSQLVHDGARIRRAGVHGGYIWLEDVDKRAWRYVVGEEQTKTVLEARKQGARKAGAGSDRPAFRAPFVCAMIPDCKVSIEAKEQRP